MMYVWRRTNASVSAVICLVLASATAASGFPVRRLHDPLGPDESVAEFSISPDQSRVVFVVAEILARTTNGVRYGAQSLFSAPVSGGPLVRLDDPSLGVTLWTSQSPLITSDSQSVVFMSRGEQGAFSSIFRTSIDGSDLVRVANSNAICQCFPTSLQLSHNSSHVIFLQDDVISLSVDGGGHVVLNPPLGPGDRIPDLLVHPDSSRILFSLIQQGRRDVWSVNPDGTDRVRLNASHSAGEGGVRAVSDTGLAVFNSQNNELFSVPVDGSAPPTLLAASSNTHLHLNANFSPDGQRVVFDQQTVGVGVTGLFSVPAMGGTPVQVTAPLAAHEWIDHFYDFTADSQSILYTVYGENHRLYRALLDGSEIVQLNALTATGVGLVEGVTLSPDGKTVVYIDDHDADGIRDLFLVSLDGGAPVQVTDSSSNSIDIRLVEFSPNGQRLAFHSETQIDDVFEPFIVEVDNKLEDFGMTLFRPVGISLSNAETQQFQFLGNNLGLIAVGSLISTRELFVIRIPEPSSFELASYVCLCAMCVAKLQSRRW